MNVFWEAMVAEMRAERLEADNRRHFTPEKEPIELVRGLLHTWTGDEEPETPEEAAARSATSLRMGAQDDLFELG